MDPDAALSGRGGGRAVRELRLGAGRLPPDLDPALPELRTALDPAVIAMGFERSGAVRVRHCEVTHLRWAPGIGCEAAVRLRLVGAADPTAGAVVVRPGGVEHRLLDADPGLPGLAAATDPGRVAARLGEMLGRRVTVRGITPVSYRPGSRCMLRYELGGDRGEVVFGKVVADRAFEVLAAAVTALGGDLAPALVGVAPEWRLVVQADAGGPSLRSLAVAPLQAGALPHLREGGRLLARLHARPGLPGPRRSLTGDAASLREHLALVERAAPAAAARFAGAVDRLAAAPGGAAPAVPSHGALRLDHIHLTSAGGPVFIDLDSRCHAEPAHDLGTLLAYLRWREIRLPAMAETLAAVRTAVLEGYARGSGGGVDADRLALHRAAASLKIAGRCLQKLSVAEWELVPRLVGAVLEDLGAPAGVTR